ncbi:deaminated glutathione amidase isoform X3 [Poecile atricapillus]|uniref:deaminated glutathione amidase isoform X3 n=1 Tax=Poecile atricapillus TaxID=48891 RepID=UPI00273862A0|nr:deaminated glutathione amidase isoform X3 [Poecile atricapillus]
MYGNGAKNGKNGEKVLRVPPRALLCRPPRPWRAPHSSSTAGSPSAMAESPGGLVAVAQVTSTADKEHNWQQCSALVRRAAARGARAVFLPEGFDFIGDSPQQSLALAEPLDGDIVGRYQQLARECDVWLSLGGFHERGQDWDSTGRIYNCHLLLDNSGVLVAAYRKLHLFDAALPGAPALCESSFTNPGRELLPPIATPVGKVLLRARAIECQCYVVAAAQTGRHNPSRASWGHSLVADPWGTVVAQCQEGPGLCLAQLDLAYLEQVRRGLPVHGHRRGDIYGALGTPGT